MHNGNYFFAIVIASRLFSTVPYPTPSYPILSYLILPYPALSYPTLPYHTISYPTIPCPTLDTLHYNAAQYCLTLYHARINMTDAISTSRDTRSALNIISRAECSTSQHIEYNEVMYFIHSTALYCTVQCCTHSRTLEDTHNSTHNT